MKKVLITLAILTTVTTSCITPKIGFYEGTCKKGVWINVGGDWFCKKVNAIDTTLKGGELILIHKGEIYELKQK